MRLVRVLTSTQADFCHLWRWLIFIPFGWMMKEEYFRLLCQTDPCCVSRSSKTTYFFTLVTIGIDADIREARCSWSLICYQRFPRSLCSAELVFNGIQFHSESAAAAPSATTKQRHLLTEYINPQMNRVLHSDTKYNIASEYKYKINVSQNKYICG